MDTHPVQLLPVLSVFPIFIKLQWNFWWFLHEFDLTLIISKHTVYIFEGIYASYIEFGNDSFFYSFVSEGIYVSYIKFGDEFLVFIHSSIQQSIL